MEAGVPQGLALSLDDLIKQQADSYGKARRQKRSGGPSGEGGGRGSQGYVGAGRGPPPRQQHHQPPPHHQQQQQHRGFAPVQFGGPGAAPFILVAPGFPPPQLGGQQQQQQQQQGGRANGGGGGGRPVGGVAREQARPRGQPQRRPPGAYRSQQTCTLEEGSGDVVVTFKGTEIVRASPAGDLTLRCDGYFTPPTLASLNDVLNPLGIRVTCPSGQVSSAEWSISDGRTLTRFTDGVVVRAKGAQHIGRGRSLLDAFAHPHREAAAAATAASNAAAMQAGIIPHTGFVPPGRPGTGRGPPPASKMDTDGDSSGRSVFARLGGRAGGGKDARFAPY